MQEARFNFIDIITDKTKLNIVVYEITSQIWTLGCASDNLSCCQRYTLSINDPQNIVRCIQICQCTSFFLFIMFFFHPPFFSHYFHLLDSLFPLRRDYLTKGIASVLFFVDYGKVGNKNLRFVWFMIMNRWQISFRFAMPIYGHIPIYGHTLH